MATTRKCDVSSGSKRTAISRSHTLVAAVVIVLLAGCAGNAKRETSPLADIADSGLRLEARPRADAKPCAPGEYELHVAQRRRTLMRVTPRRRGRPPALLLALHGAGSGGAPGGLYAFRGAWNEPPWAGDSRAGGSRDGVDTRRNRRPVRRPSASDRSGALPSRSSAPRGWRVLIRSRHGAVARARER